MEQFVKYLSEAYRELVEGFSYSKILNLDISDAPAQGNAERLLICVGKYESNMVVFGRLWVVDESGLRKEKITSIVNRHPDGYLLMPDPKSNPKIGIEHATNHVYLSIRFGTDWSRNKSAELDEAGLIVSESFRDIE